jgi:hypothetical protein
MTREQIRSATIEATHMTDHKTKPLTKGDLAGFIGSETIYRHPLFQKLYTEGVQFVAERGGAYWLLDVIFSHQTDPKAKAEDFQVWTVKKTPAGGCTVIMTNGGTDEAIIRQDIEYTDFPLDDFQLYFEGNETLLLPSEH